MGDGTPTFRVGDLSITKIEEQRLHGLPSTSLFPGSTPADLDAAKPALAGCDLDASGETLTISVHAWLVRTPDQVVLIDTGSGDNKERPGSPGFHRQSTPFLERLALAGVRPEEVDLVLNSHLHVDHVGWNTRLVDGRWVPTFPRARYVLPSREVAYYSSPESHNEANRPSLGVYEDSVRPILEAGLAELVGPEGGRVHDLFTFEATPGHSIGHMTIHASSSGADAVFAGDVLHHPMQVRRPDLNTVFCEFQDDARASRARVLGRAADGRAFYLSTHFPGSSAGHVSRTADGFRWTYA